MRESVLFLTLLLFGNKCLTAQTDSLLGTWQGTFSEGLNNLNYEIKLVVERKDTIHYVGYTFSTEKNFSGFATMTLTPCNNNKYQLVETKLISGKDGKNNSIEQACLMSSILVLKRKKNKFILEGNYAATNNVTNTSCADGFLKLYKIK